MDKQNPCHKLHCCEKCQVFWTCETKWYRGERNEENICCPICNYYYDCLSKNKQKTSSSEK